VADPAGGGGGSLSGNPLHDMRQRKAASRHAQPGAFATPAADAAGADIGAKEKKLGPLIGIMVVGGVALVVAAEKNAWGARERTAGLAALTCVAVVVLFATCPQLPQPLKYHDFADQRCLCCGVPNTADVLSNAPFLLVSAIGLDHILGGTALGALGMGNVLGAPVFADRAVELPLWITFFLGVGLVALGSGYYHWKPDNARLIWDRLPMTIGFMALLAVVLTDTVIEATAEATNATLGVLITLGLASVVWWARYDDLRPYVLVQFYSLFLVPLLLALFPSRYDGANAEIVTALAFCKRSSSLGPFFEPSTKPLRCAQTLARRSRKGWTSRSSS